MIEKNLINIGSKSKVGVVKIYAEDFIIESNNPDVRKLKVDITRDGVLSMRSGSVPTTYAAEIVRKFTVNNYPDLQDAFTERGYMMKEAE